MKPMVAAVRKPVFSQGTQTRFTFTAKQPGEIGHRHVNVPRLKSGENFTAPNKEAAWALLAQKLECKVDQAKATHRLSPTTK